MSPAVDAHCPRRNRGCASTAPGAAPRQGCPGTRSAASVVNPCHCHKTLTLRGWQGWGGFASAPFIYVFCLTHEKGGSGGAGHPPSPRGAAVLSPVPAMSLGLGCASCPPA